MASTTTSSIISGTMPTAPRSPTTEHNVSSSPAKSHPRPTQVDDHGDVPEARFPHNYDLPQPESVSEDSIAFSVATENSQNEPFAFGMEKGFWRVQQGAQELLRFADLYRNHRDSKQGELDFSTMVALPKEIDLVSMTQLSWGVMHAVSELNNHNRRAAESCKWMRKDEKGSHRRHKRSRRMASSDLSSFTACKTCGIMDTPRWRDGPAGPLTLCNVCGLLYAKRSRRLGSGSESCWRQAEQPGAKSG